MEKENEILRWNINPNTLESMIREGKVSVGVGIPIWREKSHPDLARQLGLERLVYNIKVGNERYISKRFKEWYEQYLMIKKLEQ